MNNLTLLSSNYFTSRSTTFLVYKRTSTWRPCATLSLFKRKKHGSIQDALCLLASVSTLSCWLTLMRVNYPLLSSAFFDWGGLRYGTKPGHFETSMIYFPTSEGVSGASKRANGRTSDLVLTSRFLFVPDHSGFFSGLRILLVAYTYTVGCMYKVHLN